jgi:hypothetical protein
MDTKIVEQWHPKLIGKDYKIIPTENNLNLFNCYAFTIGDYKNWHGHREDNWPSSIGSRFPSIDNYIKFYNLYGFNICDNDEYDEEFNKIAIYTNNKDWVSHAAKQYNNMWRSKLGTSCILEHELEWISGFDYNNYGKVHLLMKKKI